MAKSRKLEQLLAQLDPVQRDPHAPESTIVLREVLTSKHSIAVAQAAKLIGAAERYDLIPDLVAAFDRYMIKPVETDPGCTAKLKIADALYRLEYSNEDLFLRGIRHKEPSWGGSEDTATALRGTCALGLVRMNYPQVMSELADLLADSIQEARIAAARAISYSGDPTGVPLLRLRVQIGDTAPVLSECFLALLQLSPQLSLSLISSFLTSRLSEVAEVAALALGESRLPEALPILQTWWQRTRITELRQTALTAIALLRQDEAIAFLLGLICEGEIADAKTAIAALSIYHQDPDLWRRVCEAASQREDPSLLVLLRTF
jgi:HEAT repeat protein